MEFPLVTLVESEGETDAIGMIRVKTTIIEIRHPMDYATEANLEVYRRRYLREETEKPKTADGFIKYLNEHGIAAIKQESHGNMVLG